MSNGKPVCGSQGARTDDVLKWFIALVGVGGTIASGIFGVKSAVAGAVGGAAPSAFLGIAAPFAIWGAAVLGALVMLGLVFSFWWNRCLSDPDALQACSAGVVNAAVPSFNSTSDAIFPFTAMHDRLDVVIKSRYWPLVEGGGASFVFCAGDPESSPVIQCFYKDDEVCAAGAGATIGGIAGAIGGIIAGAAIAAAITCLTVILCIFALLVALLVAAAAVLIGAIVGGLIGRAAAGSSSPTAAGGQAILVGNYVTTKGGLVTLGDAQHARVYWFVDETTLHGASAGSPEFSFTDPDANLTVDACPVRPDPIG